MNQRISRPGFAWLLFAGFTFGIGCSSQDGGVPPSGTTGSGGNTNAGGGAGTGASGTGGSGDSGGSAGASTGAGGTAQGGASGGAGAPPAGDAGGDSGKWQYSRAIQLDTTASGANVTGDVPKYPVAVALTAANFDFSQAKDKGADLRFAGADGTPLPYAIEFWDSAAKVAAVWVKVDVKGNSKTQPITMSWGNRGATDASDSHAVFDTNDGFVGVWHLSEAGSTTASAYKDATGNGADATGVAMQAGSIADGRIGKAASLAHAQNQWIRVESAEKNTLFDIYDKMTFSIWVQPKSHTVDYQCMFSKGEGGFRIYFYGAAEWNGGKHITEICVEGPDYDECPVNHSGVNVEPGKWFHLVGVTDHPKITYYINGAVEASDNDPSPWKSDATKPVIIGNNSSNLKRSFDGLLDEARVMKVPKDAFWVKLEYESQKEGQKFLTMGETQKRF